jgi:hypothetical protein
VRAKINRWIEVSLSRGPNKVVVFLLSPEDGQPVSEMLNFIVFRIPDDEQSTETQ